MTFGTIVLGFVTLQRASELVLARYNTVKLLNRGALEIAPGHYWLLVAMHGAWLVALWIWGRNQPVNLLWLSVFVILQVLRVWVIASLGSNWTTRIIVLPGTPLVSTGAYRFMSHPNYVVVACEIVVLPLALSLPIIALVFTALNALMLTIRIRAENRALKHAAPPSVQ